MSLRSFFKKKSEFFAHKMPKTIEINAYEWYHITTLEVIKNERNLK